MSRPVLLGGRTGLRTRSLPLWLLLVWLPVVAVILVIARESTDAFSSAHTSGWLRHLFEALFGPITEDRWESVHYDIRKTGHFVGYGLIGLAWTRAWMLTWLTALRRRATWIWRTCGVIMGLCCTMITAAADEIHQTYIPSRTGLATDALLDTAGAITLLLLVGTFWLRRPWQPPLDRA